MQPGGYHPRSNKAPSGGACGNGAGFRYGRNSDNSPPSRLPAPPGPTTGAPQMTPQQREEILMAAGLLAAEYLVDKGELPPKVLQNSPPVPLPFQERPPAPQHHQQPSPRPFHERPLARQHFQRGARPFQRPPALRPFQERPIAKCPRPPAPRPFKGRPPAPRGPRQFQARPPFPSGARGPAPPVTGYSGQGAAPPGEEMHGEGCNAPAGVGARSKGQPVPKSGGTARSPQTTNQQN